MIGNIGMPGLILILVIALIVFGPNKLPELGRAVGRTLKEFKSATKNLTADDEEEVKPKAKKAKKKVEVEEVEEAEEVEVVKEEETDTTK